MVMDKTTEQEEDIMSLILIEQVSQPASQPASQSVNYYLFANKQTYKQLYYTVKT